MFINKNVETYTLTVIRKVSYSKCNSEAYQQDQVESDVDKLI